MGLDQHSISVEDIDPARCWLDATQVLSALQQFLQSYNKSDPVVYNSSVARFSTDPTFCAFEQDTCKCTGEVLYGPILRGKWWGCCDFDHYAGPSTLEEMRQGPHSTKFVNGSIGCSSSVFGDPRAGEAKYCRCVPHAGLGLSQLRKKAQLKPEKSMPDRSTFCAYEGGKCACNGTILFGPMLKAAGQGFTSLDEMSSGKFDSAKPGPGSTLCKVGVFKDVAPGQAKLCRCVHQ